MWLCHTNKYKKLVSNGFLVIILTSSLPCWVPCWERGDRFIHTKSLVNHQKHSPFSASLKVWSLLFGGCGINHEKIGFKVCLWVGKLWSETTQLLFFNFNWVSYSRRTAYLCLKMTLKFTYCPSISSWVQTIKQSSVLTNFTMLPFPSK